MGYFRTAMLLAAMTALFMGIGYLVGGQTGMVIALLVAAAMNLFAYWNSDKMVLSMYGAREVDARAAPELYGLVQQLAANAELPMPKVYIMDNPQPNAFATGRNPENAAVAVTTGLLERLNRDELAGVLAHELGHIKHRDTLTMTITATLAGAISMVANFGFYFGGGNRNSNGIGPIGGVMLRDPRADRRRARAVRHQPRARIRGGPHRRRDQRAPAVARLCLAQDFKRCGAASPIPPLSAIPRRRISSSSTRCPARAWTISSPLTPMWRTASPCSTRWPRAWDKALAYSPCRPAHAPRDPGARRKSQATGSAGPGTRTRA